MVTAGGRAAPEPAGDAADARGIALITVLWVLVLLGSVSAAFFADAMAERRSVANLRAGVESRWTARASMARVLDRLDRVLGERSRSLATTGDTLLSPLDLRLNELPVRAVLLDSRARLNLNRAGAPRLRHLFRSLGLRNPSAERLASGISGGRFSHVGQLARLPELTGSRLARIAPHLTVAGDGRINVNTATAPVLSTLPGIDLPSGRMLAAAREDSPFRNVSQVLAALPPEKRRDLRAREDALGEMVAYGPRHVELVVHAVQGGEPGTELLRSVIELEGGSAWRILRTREW